MRLFTSLTSNFLGGSLLILLVNSCACFPTQAVFHSPNPGLTIEIGKKDHGQAAFRARVEAFPGAVLCGLAVPGLQGGWKLEITSLRWFDNWPNGWTDARFLAEGSLNLDKTAQGWTLRVDDPPVLDSVESASIRYFDEDLVGERGLEEFSHRWDRILATARFLAQKFPPAWINAASTVRSFLFPEVWGYPSGVKPGSSFHVADSIAWDTEYTSRNFPPNLQQIRNGGTLLRDYEESPGLWTLAVQWKDFWRNAKKGPVIIKSS